MKKIITALLAMVMVFSIGVNAFAITDTTNVKNNPNYIKFEEEMTTFYKILSECDEDEGYFCTYESGRINLMGDGLCKSVVRLSIGTHKYRIITIYDIIEGKTAVDYVIRDDGLRYTTDEFWDIVED